MGVPVAAPPADPDRVLAELHAAMRPGGLVAVAEMREPLRFLPDDDVEERVLAIMRARLEYELPHLGSDWPARLTAAGFSVIDAHEVEIDVADAPGANRYAWLWFDRLRGGLADQLADDDRTALDALLDGDGPDAIMRRTDLHVRGTRTVLLVAGAEIAHAVPYGQKLGLRMVGRNRNSRK